jgi:type I restriction enzyme S subunit
MSDENGHLPDGWKVTTVGEVTTLCRRGRSPAYDGGATQVVNQKCVRAGTSVDLQHSKLTNEAARALPEWVLLKQGDVLVNSTGKGTLGRVGWLRETPSRVTADTHVAIVRAITELVSPQFLGWYLHSMEQDLVALSTGSTEQKELKATDLAAMRVPLPPRTEQDRIVRKVEEMLRWVGIGEQRFVDASTGLARFRASVVAGALSGDVAVDPEGDSASAMLQGILARRRDTWERAELERLSRRRGGPPATDDWKRRYPEPMQPAPPDGWELPDGWTWATVDQLSTMVQYGSSAKTGDDSNGVPVLRMGNIQGGRLLLAALKYLPREHDEFPSLFVEEGDILFNRTNSPELVGKVAVARGLPVPCSFASYLIRVRLADGVVPEWVSYFLNSAHGRAWVRSVVTQQVGQANVNGTKLRAVTVPLPPRSVQDHLVREVDSYLQSASHMTATLVRSRKQATDLKRSVLQAAFSGQLDTRSSSGPPVDRLVQSHQRGVAERGTLRRTPRKNRRAASTAE